MGWRSKGRCCEKENLILMAHWHWVGVLDTRQQASFLVSLSYIHTELLHTEQIALLLDSGHHHGLSHDQHQHVLTYGFASLIFFSLFESLMFRTTTPHVSSSFHLHL
jgi:hypothetical protein